MQPGETNDMEVTINSNADIINAQLLLDYGEQFQLETPTSLNVETGKPSALSLPVASSKDAKTGEYKINAVLVDSLGNTLAENEIKFKVEEPAVIELPVGRIQAPSINVVQSKVFNAVSKAVHFIYSERNLILAIVISLVGVAYVYYYIIRRK